MSCEAGVAVLDALLQGPPVSIHGLTWEQQRDRLRSPADDLVEAEDICLNAFDLVLRRRCNKCQMQQVMGMTGGTTRHARVNDKVQKGILTRRLGFAWLHVCFTFVSRAIAFVSLWFRLVSRWNHCCFTLFPLLLHSGFTWLHCVWMINLVSLAVSLDVA